MFVFFFFKQKTAYEMRISDWSSDVCSSDLRQVARWLKGDAEPGIQGFFRLQGGGAQSGRQCRGGRRGLGRRRDQEAGRWADRRARSEEHTSELQSLMRISYAVFCLSNTNREKRTLTQTSQMSLVATA